MAFVGSRRALLTRGFLPQSLAYFARLTPEPSMAFKIAYNGLIVALQAAGCFSNQDAIYGIATAQSQWARQNIRQNLYNLTAFNSPAFTALQGYKGDGISAYLNSNFNASTAISPNYTRNSACAWGWKRESATDAGAMIGAASPATGAAEIYPRYTDGNAYAAINGTLNKLIQAVANGSGLWVVSRPDASTVNLYRNGVLVKTAADASAAVFNGAVLFLRYSNQYQSGTIMAGGFGASIDNNVVAHYAAWSNFFATIGAS